MSIQNKRISITIMFLILVLLITVGCAEKNKREEVNQPKKTEVTKDSENITITLASTGGERWVTDKTVKKGEKFGELPIPEREGYQFLGWYDRERGGTRLLRNQIVELEKDATYYGQWLKKEGLIQGEGEISNSGIPILMYHWFYEGEPDYEQSTEGNWMPIEEFKEQMEYLHEDKFYFPSWDELEAFIDGNILLPKKSIIITVDDGREDFFRLAVPVLKDNDIDVTSFVITSKIDNEKLDKFADDSIEYGSHSENLHVRGDRGIGVAMNMTSEEIREDLEKSRDKVGDTKVFCYPFGHVSENMKEALTAENFTMAVTISYGSVHPGIDKLEIPRIRMNSGMSIESYKQVVNHRY